MRIVAAHGLRRGHRARHARARGRGHRRLGAGDAQARAHRGPARARQGARRRGEVRSAVSVPIADEDGILGVLNVGSRDVPGALHGRAHGGAHAPGHADRGRAAQRARAWRRRGSCTSPRCARSRSRWRRRTPTRAAATERVARYATLLGDEHGAGGDRAAGARGRGAAARHRHERGGGDRRRERPAALDGRARTAEAAPGARRRDPRGGAGAARVDPDRLPPPRVVRRARATWSGWRARASRSASRILAVADAFVAMTSDRPYRAAMIDGARRSRNCRTKAGTQFDPEVGWSVPGPAARASPSWRRTRARVRRAPRARRA